MRRRPDRGPPLDAALVEARARYARLRACCARCLYAAHKLRGEAERQRSVAAASRRRARLAFEAGDARRSRRMVASARAALDLAEEADQARGEVRARADAALGSLRDLGRAVATLERERLRSVAAPEPLAVPPRSVQRVLRALELRDAERELEAELALGPGDTFRE